MALNNCILKKQMSKRQEMGGAAVWQEEKRNNGPRAARFASQRPRSILSYTTLDHPKREKRKVKSRTHATTGAPSRFNPFRSEPISQLPTNTIQVGLQSTCPDDVLLEISDFYVVQSQRYVEEWRILVTICRLNSPAYATWSRYDLAIQLLFMMTPFVLELTRITLCCCPKP